MNKLKALPIVAAMLGDKLGVKVVIGGDDTAKTDGCTIYLPALPMDAEEELVGLVSGYIDHEAAHIRHTDFGVLGSCSTPIIKHIANTIEDYRIEHEIIKRYPGCHQHFQWLIRNRFLNNQNKNNANNPDSFLILDYILLSLRAMDVPELNGKCREIKGIMDGHWIGLAVELECIIGAVPGDCNSTDDCKKYAEKIIGILEKYDQQEDEAEQNSVPLSLISDSQNCANKSGNSDRTSNDSQTNNDLNKGSRRLLQQLLKAGDDDLPASYDDDLATTIQGLSGQNNERVEIAIPSTMQVSVLPEKNVQEALRASTGISTKISALLQASVLKRSCPSRSGKIDGRRLYRLKSANPYLFKRHEERPGIDTAVHILLDASGSMHNTIEVACSACYGCSLALSRIPNVSVGITAFPAKPCGDIDSTVFPLLHHGERISRQMMVKASGSTPLAQALMFVLKTMQSLKKKRKILIVISDGQPDDTQMAMVAIKAIREQGIELFGVGIGRSKLGNLIEKSCSITNIVELSTCLFEILKDSLCL